MRSMHVVMVALALTIPVVGQAQSGATPVAGVTAQDSTQPVPKKKKGGLFGKVKGLAKSKVVKTVAKAALCTAVPGGSLIAGALDAKNAKGAAGAAAGTAAGLATGSSGGCMPGMGMAGKAGGAAGLAGVAGVGVPGMPTTGMPSANLSAAQLQQMQGAPGGTMSPEQLKQMEEQYRKMGMQPAQIKAMQQQMQAMQQMMAQTPSTAGEGQMSAMAPPSSPPSAPPSAPGASVLTVEKGGLVLHQLPWTPGSNAIQAGSEPVFGLAMRDVAAAIQGTGKKYKIEVRVEEQGKKDQNKRLSHQRGAAVVAGLVAEGIPTQRLKVVDAGSDKDPRVLLHETK
jgi:hypothetical protein